MSQPVKWARDFHLRRERAARTETWSRQDLETCSMSAGLSPRSLQRRSVRCRTWLVPISSIALLCILLEAIIAAPSVEEGKGAAGRSRARSAAQDIRVSLPADSVMPCCPTFLINITLSPRASEGPGRDSGSMLACLVALRGSDQWLGEVSKRDEATRAFTRCCRSTPNSVPQG